MPEPNNDAPDDPAKDPEPTDAGPRTMTDRVGWLGQAVVDLTDRCDLLGMDIQPKANQRAPLDGWALWTNANCFRPGFSAELSAWLLSSCGYLGISCIHRDVK